MRIEHDVRRTILADRFEGRRFGGPNDVVVRSDGAIYFTDTYGAPPSAREGPSQGA